MVRVGVSIYLILTTLAGPWLCCCTTTRLRAAATSASAAERHLPTSPVHQSCCCHHKATTPDNESGRKAPKERSSPDRSCPCHQRQSNLVSLQTSGARLAQDLLAAHASQPLLAPVAALPAAGLLHGGGRCTLGTACDLPFLTTQDVLHSLHILRC
jgi:hypothetical protein